jgi:hypothetical protein
MSDYRAPAPYDKDGNVQSPDAILGWLREAHTEGENFIRGQRAYADLDAAYDIIAGPGSDEKLPKSLSRVYVNRLKRQIQENVAVESNLRPLWGYKTDNEDVFGSQSHILNKLMNGWWLDTFADRSIRSVNQYSYALGTGYLSPIWEKDFWTYGRGDVKLEVLGPRDVLPIQLPKDGNLQKAYAVMIRVEVPIAMAHAMYPTFADQIKPTRSQPTWARRLSKKIQRFFSPALNVGGRQSNDQEVNCPSVDLYYTYILDQTLNGTNQVIPMGKPGTSWYYEVPYIGMDIEVGKDANGAPIYRKATAEDARMFPLRRLLISADNNVLLNPEPSEQTSPWWHASVPLVKFTNDDWPWEYLGFSPVRDGGSIQESINRLKRVVDDSANCKLRPPLAIDENGMAESDQVRLDTRQPNQRIRVNMAMGDPVKPLLPHEYYTVGADIWKHIESLENDLDYVMASRDMSALARARQLPSADTLEKFFEAMGPIVQDRSRNAEKSLRELGEMVKCLFFQFYTSRRIIQQLGEDGIVAETFDYNPNSLIPAPLPDEKPWQHMARIRHHCNSFHFHVTPNSLHQITQMSRQLILLQLQKTGFPLDPWTIGKAFDLPDLGPEPKGTKNIIERYVAWTRMRGELQTEMAAEAQAALAEAQGQQQMKQAAANLVPERGPGRPSTGAAAPQLKVKDSGTRTTIQESR